MRFRTNLSCQAFSSMVYTKKKKNGHPLSYLVKNLIINSIIVLFLCSSKSLMTVTFDQIKGLLRQGGNTVKVLVENKHYNKDFPENHNLLLKRKKEHLAQVFRGNKFVDIPIDEVLDHLIFT